MTRLSSTGRVSSGRMAGSTERFSITSTDICFQKGQEQGGMMAPHAPSQGVLSCLCPLPGKVSCWSLSQQATEDTLTPPPSLATISWKNYFSQCTLNS